MLLHSHFPVHTKRRFVVVSVLRALAPVCRDIVELVSSVHLRHVLLHLVVVGLHQGRAALIYVLCKRSTANC